MHKQSHLRVRQQNSPNEEFLPQISQITPDLSPIHPNRQPQTTNEVLTLQRTVGNRATRQVLNRSTKAETGQKNTQPVPTAVVQRSGEDSPEFNYGFEVPKINPSDSDFMQIILANKQYYRDFKNYCTQEWSMDNFNGYEDIKSYEKNPTVDKADYIYNTYLASGSVYELNIPSAPQVRLSISNKIAQYRQPQEQTPKKRGGLLSWLFKSNKPTSQKPDANLFEDIKKQVSGNLLDTYNRWVLQNKEKEKGIKGFLGGHKNLGRDFNQQYKQYTGEKTHVEQLGKEKNGKSKQQAYWLKKNLKDANMW